MNVLYDISVLGYVHGKSAPKTGIPRVVETLAYQLSEFPDCHLELCSGEHLTSSLDYARSEPRLKSVEFPYNRFSASFHRKSEALQQTIDTASGLLRLSARVQRKMLSRVAKYGKPLVETLDSDSLRHADIYHSSFLAPPAQVKIAKRPQIFITIYDLIPLLFPDQCDAGTNERMQQIVSAIDKDIWLISISEATKIDFCNHCKINPDHIFVTPLAADTTLFYPNHSTEEQAAVRQKYHIGGGPYVLSLCTIEPRKNIDHVIRCFVTLMQEQKLTDLNLVLAGAKGWSYDHIFKEIEGAEALKDNIVVTGFVANEDLAALYSGAMAFVYPSLYEGFGLPPLEAMQCGTPVITSNTSSLPEVVGDAGIMLDPKDADGLCQSLLSLYEDGDLRAAMSVKSLARAAQFSWKRCAEETVQAYRTALGQ